METTLPYQTIRLSPLRKIIAARMTEAKQTIPHYRVSADINMESLFALREQHNAERPDQKVSVNDYVIKATAMSLMQCPAINCQLVDGEIHQYQQADISIVVAVEGGLSTPILRKANTLTVEQISQQVKELAKRAQEGSLKMEEIQGGSFSLSSLGMYNVDGFDAIINPPQCGILAVGSAKEQVIVKEGEVVTARIMRVNLSLDHRVIDGAEGAEFVNDLRTRIETANIID